MMCSRSSAVWKGTVSLWIAGALVGPALFTMGCASTDASRLAKLQRRLAELSQTADQRDKQLESLNNRLFLLEDKVDTSRVAIARRGRPKPLRLPVIRIRPEDADVRRDGDVGDPASIRIAGRASGRSLVSSDDVEYAGAALRSHGPRRVLKLRGQATTSTSAPRPRPRTPRRLSGIDPSTVKEKIPVVPVAKGQIARKMAKAAPGSTLAMRAYMRALATYRKGRYSSAASAFRSFLGRYAKHTYADNALYWLGECFYDLKNFRLSAKMFRRVVEEYPNGNKAPAALLKLGFSYMKLKEKKNARTVLAQVVEIFPRTRVARLARRELSRLKIQ